MAKTGSLSARAKLNTSVLLRMPLLVFLVLASPLALTSYVAAQSATVVRFSKIDEVITKWQPGQHLYVQGDVGLPDSKLTELESWLDSNGKSWTIVLMQTSSGQDYVSANGQLHLGMDAVEFAMGEGLRNKSSFNTSYTHPKTGEKNGTIFMLFMTDRKFSLISSDAQDRRRAGASQWIGDLDRSARRAMRNGGRVADAVKDTVDTINDRVDRAIAGEERARAAAVAEANRIKAEKDRQLAELKSTIELLAGERIDEVTQRSAKLRGDYPEAAESKLGRPPVDSWKTELAAVRTKLSLQTLGESDSKLKVIRDAIDEYRDAYAAHDSFNAMLDTAEDNLLTLENDKTGAAADHIEEIKLLITDARAGHASGNLDFAEKIHRAHTLTQVANGAIREKRIEMDELEAKRSVIRKTLGWGAAALAAALALWLMLLNRFRRPALKRAVELFEKRNGVVQTQLDNNAKVISRTETLLGTQEQFSKNRYEGLTEEAGKLAFSNAEALSSLGTEATRAMESANSLLHPGNAISEAFNMFTSGRYLECIEELNGQSFKGPGKSGSDSWMHFDEFVGAIGFQQSAATENLDRIENGFQSVNNSVKRLDEQIESCADVEEALSDANRLDRLFAVPSLFEKLIPAAQKEYQLARSLTDSDPIRVTEEVATRGLEILGDGAAVATAIQEMRENVFPELDSARDSLRELGYESRWIKARVEQLGDQADQLFEKASQENATSDARHFHLDTIAVGTRAKRCVELANDVKENVAPSLEGLKDAISNAREETGRQLSVAADLALHEQEHDPDVDLEQGYKQLESARAALNIGGVESAMESLDEVALELGQGHTLIEESMALLSSFRENHDQSKQQHSRIASSVPEHETLTAKAASLYDHGAMVLRSGLNIDSNSTEDASNAFAVAEGSLTMDVVMARCHELLTNSSAALDRAMDTYQKSGVFESAAIMAAANADVAGTSRSLEMVKAQCRRLDELAEENKIGLKEQLARLLTLDKERDDIRTRVPTIELLNELNSALNQFNMNMQADATRDPFEDAQQLADFESSAQEALSRITADRQTHKEASDAVKAADSELQATYRLVERAENDQIPDSAVTRRAVEATISNGKELTTLFKLMEQPHQEWVGIHDRALHCYSKLGIIGGDLRRELELAQQCVLELDGATRKVMEAANWSGSYSVRISSNYGSREIAHARQSLANGDYGTTIRLSRQAFREADRAIDNAESEVRSAKRAERRRKERRRRNSMMSSSSSSSFGSSFGSSSSSSSSFGGGSSFGSSSSSGFTSGSGAARSGW